MLDKEIFKPKFGNWWEKIEPFFHLLEPIYKKLKEDSASMKRIFPTYTDTFKAFEKTDFNNLKAVVVGICPYHTKKFDGTVIADGIALSCSKTGELQPSLKNWYKAMKKEFPSAEFQEKADLSYLAENGVLMYNFALTVENRKPLIHNDLWEPFTKALFEQVISNTGVPVIFMGKECHKAAKWLAPFQWNFCISHPASAAYSGDEWNSEGAFKKVSVIIKDNTGIDFNWLPS
jgi:uracil-DNA glycosylase